MSEIMKGKILEGESIKLKQNILFLMVAWTVVVAGSAVFNLITFKGHISEIARSRARFAFEKDILYRRWNAKHGGVYVPVTDETPENPYLEVDEKTFRTPSGKLLTKMNPAYMIRQAHEIEAQQYGIQAHITSLNPIRPGNSPDMWEEKALKLFEQGEEEVDSIEMFYGEPHMRLMKPLYVEKSCLKCHERQGYQLGDVRGGISVSIPMKPLWDFSKLTIFISVVVHVFIWFLGLFWLVIFSKNLLNKTIALEKSNRKLRMTQKQLVQSEKLASIGQLSAGITHEINNPMTFITNNIEVLREYLKSYTQVFELVQRLKISVEEKNMEEAQRIVKELTDLEENTKFDFILKDVENLIEESRSGAERIKSIILELKTFAHKDIGVVEKADINEILEKILAILRNEVKYKAQVEKKYGDIPSVICNSQQIGQVFMNILVNAVHSIEKEGTITVETFVDKEFVYIEISDTGVGIPEEELQIIFDPFFTTKEIGKGTGLGLSISYEIVKAHGGDILVESIPGRGTKFSIKLFIEGEEVMEKIK